MERLILSTLLFMFVSAWATATPTESSQATYIMQVTSNLNCETLDIELISQTNNTHDNIRFKSSAFSAIELPSGDYKFGDVTCVKKGRAQVHNLLSEKMAPLHLTSGQVYFGGRIIFQEIINKDANGSPKVLDNCTRINSNARGESNSECRIGKSSETSAQTSTQINVYLPENMDKDIAVVRSALSVKKDHLLYQPLKLLENVSQYDL